MSRGFSLIELLVVIIILGILMLMAIPRFSPLFSTSAPNQYCTILRDIRTYLEMKKEENIATRCYPDTITTASVESAIGERLVDPYTNTHILIDTSEIPSYNTSCDSVPDTGIIRYCPIVSGDCVYSYKIQISDKVKQDIYPGCLLGVDTK